jgi:hypothetical protein
MTPSRRARTEAQLKFEKEHNSKKPQQRLSVQIKDNLASNSNSAGGNSSGTQKRISLRLPLEQISQTSNNPSPYSSFSDNEWSHYLHSTSSTSKQRSASVAAESSTKGKTEKGKRRFSVSRLSGRFGRKSSHSDELIQKDSQRRSTALTNTQLIDQQDEDNWEEHQVVSNRRSREIKNNREELLLEQTFGNRRKSMPELRLPRTVSKENSLKQSAQMAKVHATRSDNTLPKITVFQNL